MALRGTLADFGLPDIFQLVGHQQKTGVLLLKDREIEVRIFFVDGNVVKAEQTSKQKTELLGTLMVRAGLLTAQQLDEALATQQRTMRPLSDILVENKAVERTTLRDFNRPQTTETIYRLFRWRKGTYEFTPGAVEYDEKSYEPIRAENILMEGFRMVDEWPSVRKFIPGTGVQFVIGRDLPEPSAGGSNNEDLLAGLEEAFGDDNAADPNAGPPPRKVGDVERRIFALVTPERTAQDIIDLARIGEFETSKALATLVQNGHLRVVNANVHASADGSGSGRLTLAGVMSIVAPVLTRVTLYAVVAAAVAGFVRLASVEPGVLAPGASMYARADVLRDQVGGMHRALIARALEVYRLEHGTYPAALTDLVEQDLLSERELKLFYDTDYAYRRTDGGYALARPLR